MAALRELELECEAKEAEAASFTNFVSGMEPKLSRHAVAVLEARRTDLGRAEEHVGGDFFLHLTSYSPRSLGVPGNAI